MLPPKQTKILAAQTPNHFRESVYAPQTKILEGLTKDEMRLFEALFKGVSTRFGLRTIESPFEIRQSSFVPSSKIFVWEHTVA
jgi:hypothetical protein